MNPFTKSIDFIRAFVVYLRKSISSLNFLSLALGFNLAVLFVEIVTAIQGGRMGLSIPVALSMLLLLLVANGSNANKRKPPIYHEEHSDSDDSVYSLNEQGEAEEIDPNHK